MTFRAKEGNRNNGKGKKARQSTHVGPSEPAQRFKQQKPTRGLIFGPPQVNVELSTSGKRLRVEDGGVG